MSKTVDQIGNHLEFLGYSVELINPTEGAKPLLVARHGQHPSLLFWEMDTGMMLVRASFTVNNSSSRELKDAAINEMSAVVNIVNPYYEVDTSNGNVSVIFHAFYSGEYSKEVFGKFVNLLNTDIEKTFRLPSAAKAFMG